jgi:hypothetical protein
MSAVGIYRAVRVSWTNPGNNDLDHSEVFGGSVNNRASAVLVGSPKSVPSVSQTWLHTNLTPGDVWYYWVRCVDRSGNASTFFPVSPTGGWTATVTGIPPEDLAGGFPTVHVTTTPIAMTVNTRYIVDMATLCTLVLPLTAALGSVVKVRGLGVGLFLIAQNAGQVIHVGRRVTTVGIGGSLGIRHQYDAVTLECIVADTTFEVVDFA